MNGLQRRRAVGPGTLAALMLTVALGVGDADGASTKTRYSLVHGCFSLEAPSVEKVTKAGGGYSLGGDSAERFRMQATNLGTYLLYGHDRDFLAATAAGGAGPVDEPGPQAEWKVEEAGGGRFRLVNVGTGEGLGVGAGGALAQGAPEAFRFASAKGCADFPEAQLNARGRPGRGETPYGEVRGFIDGHMHWMSFEYGGGNFHCGRPWHRYGIPEALHDCAEIEGPNAAAAPFQNFFNFGNPGALHDTTGWPKLTAWSRHNLTYEGTYYRWLERVWKAGLRLIVAPINENRELCQFAPNVHRNPCNEMSTVRIALDDMYELQDYVDAQAGGPGKGFFQIVRDPFEARRVINNGQMAVVLELEIPELFDCRGAVPATCSREIVDRGLEEIYRAGVRSSLLVNTYDSAFAGERMYSGPVGMFLNALSRNSYGSFWDVETCEGRESDNTVDPSLPPQGSFLTNQLAALGVTNGTLPAYPPPPHCNTRGLSDLGRYTVRRMIEMGMIVNPDHMSQKAVDETLSIAEAARYSGVISPHGWMDPRNWPRIWQLGGMAFPGAGDAEAFVEAWRSYRPKGTPYYFGWGYGADLGGLATQPAPARAGSPNSVTYPFKSLDRSTTIERQRTGERLFDYPEEGVAHYGLYADWAEEVRKTGGGRIKSDFLHGAEAYLEMWERAVGVPTNQCQRRRSRVTPRGIGRIRVGASARRLLMRAGQPLRRTRAWTYCVSGKRGRNDTVTAVMTPGGRVAVVAGDVRGMRANRVAVGDRAGRLPRGADAIGGGIWTTRLRGRVLAYVVRGGIVRAVAVAGRPASRNKAALRRYIRLVPKRAPDRRPASVVGAAPRSLDPARAVPLAARRGASPFPFNCGLGGGPTA